MYNIQTLNKISPLGLNKLGNGYQYGDDLANPDAVLVRSASMHDSELGENLLAIARAGAGTNNVPVDKCAEQGIVVFNTPGANANAVKEMVFAGMLMCSRKVIPAIEWAKTLKGQGDAVGKLVEKGKGQFVGPEIKGKKLGVLGLGAIGILVANTARSFGMEVYGYDPYLSVDAAWGLSRAVKHAVSLSEIFENCDYISVHVPLTADTKGMINAAAIASMKEGARILNFSRADLVNSTDVIAGLTSGKLAAYVTDFPTDDVIGVEGVIAIPHLGASTPESEENCAIMAVDQIVDFLENGNIRNSVNFPAVSMPRAADLRLCIIHRNVPNMLSSISSEISNAGSNIENMQSQSKKEYAYTILDVAGDLNDQVLQNLKAVEGILRVRVIR